MIFASASLRARGFAAAGLLFSLTLSPAVLFGQQEAHGRKYTPPPATAHIVVTVEKNFNGKVMENAAVIFHAVKNGKDTGNMEVKTNTQGEATMDFIEAGSHVTVQVIATGYATYAEEFDVATDDKNVLVKMKRPQEQVSSYQDNAGKASTLQPGVQEHVAPPPVKKTPPTPDAGAGSGPQPAQPPQ
jgi:hypothetical protein